MKQFLILIMNFFFITVLNAQNVGIGTISPIARLSVDSSIMVDQADQNDGISLRNALVFGSDGLSGIGRSQQVGSAARNGLSFYTKGARRMTIDSTGQVGIGTINPLQALHVNGNFYMAGYLGIGNIAPSYAFDNEYGYNYMYYSLGLGTTPNSTYLLDVGTGSSLSRFRGDLLISNNGTVGGTLTVNGGKGVAYNANNSNNLKIYSFTTPYFSAVLNGFQLSAATSVSFAGGFTTVPKVFVGDIELTGGTAGELYRVQLQLYGCTTTSGTTTCSARLINTSANAVNYSISWNCIAIGY